MQRHMSNKHGNPVFNPAFGVQTLPKSVSGFASCIPLLVWLLARSGKTVTETNLTRTFKKTSINSVLMTLPCTLIVKYKNIFVSEYLCV